MKSMHDRKMDMKRGDPDSDGFFPEHAERRVLARPGEINGSKYPDTDEEILRDQNQFVKAANREKQRSDFRH